MSGPGRRRPADRERGARRRDQRDDPAGLDAARRPSAWRSSRTSCRPSTCTSRSPTGPACSRRSPSCSGCRASRSSRSCSSGLGDNARLVMVIHPMLESRFFAALRADRPARLHARPAARDPRDRRGVRRELDARAGLDRALPRPPAVRPGDPVVSLQRGLDAARARRALSERVGAEVWLKLEGANPTGSFKDRGMTCAVSAAVREGAEAVICASTGNTAASAAAYAARAGLTRRGDRARGQDRDRQARAGADARRARDRAARQLRRGAGARARARPAPPDRARQLASTRSGSRARRRRRSRSSRSSASSTRCASRSATPATSPPTGRASARPARGAADARLPGRRARRRSCTARRVENPETVASAIRIGNPARWEEAMAAMTRLARRDRARSPTREILDAYRLLAAREGVFCEPASAARRRRAARARRRGRRARRVRADRPRPQGPADRARAGRRGRAVRAGARGGRARPSSADATRRRPRPRPRLLGEPRARASTCSRRRSRCTSSSRSWRPARFAVETDLPIARDRRNLVVRGVRAAASGRRLHLPHPLGDPALAAASARARRRSSPA